MATAGGTEDGRLGTSAPRIAAAIRSDLDAGADGVARPARPGQRGAQPGAGPRGARRPADRAAGPRQRGAARRGRDPGRRPGQRRRHRSTRSPRRPSRRRHMAKLPRGLTMPEIRLVVIDPAGLHARPAARFVQAASRFASRIVHPSGRPRGRREEPHRPARPDDPPVVRDHPRGRRPRRRGRAGRPRRGARPVRRASPADAHPTRRRKHPMSSPTMSQKLTAEAIGTAILVFIGAGSVPLTVFLTGDEPVRQRRAVDDLVRVRVRDLRRRLLGRPHQRLPHQPGRDDRPAGHPQDRLARRRSATSARSSSARSSAPA